MLLMKISLFAYLLLIITTACKAQVDSAAAEVPLSNSFKELYRKSNPALQYDYNESRQVHDYSGNWDFDGDGKKDSLLFVGNGGVHSYFHLRIVLSKDQQRRDYAFLVTDLPLLAPVNALKRGSALYAQFPQFVVHDFDKDGQPEIYFNTDISFAPIPAKWKRRGLTSRHVLIDYREGEVRLGNFR